MACVSCCVFKGEKSGVLLYTPTPPDPPRNARLLVSLSQFRASVCLLH